RNKGEKYCDVDGGTWNGEWVQGADAQDSGGSDHHGENAQRYFVTRESARSPPCPGHQADRGGEGPSPQGLSQTTHRHCPKPSEPAEAHLQNRTTGLIEHLVGMSRWHHKLGPAAVLPHGPDPPVCGQRPVSDPAGELEHVQDFLGAQEDHHRQTLLPTRPRVPCLKKAEAASPTVWAKQRRTHPNIDHLRWCRALRTST
ncbi:heparan sulfate glucosamine 3-O-sulfotransferase 3A1-like protein, partial [Lates japonicus]